VVAITVVDFHLCVYYAGVVFNAVKYGECLFRLCVKSMAAVMYGCVYESNYIISIMIKLWDTEDNYVTKRRGNAGYIELLMRSCVEVVHMVV
jgi:hypothetical protein